MNRTRDKLVPITETFSDLDGPVKKTLHPPPQAIHHFTQADQVDQLVGASEADPDMGFMARLMALCSLPRTNPGNRKEYVRRNGPYALVMSAGGLNKLPFGNLPRLLLAWVCTEAVRTQSRELVLGRSLSEFMRTLGVKSASGGVRGEQTRIRNQMDRLFNASVQLIYENQHGKSTVSSFVADQTEFWWDPTRPDRSHVMGEPDQAGREILPGDHRAPSAARHAHPQGPQALLPEPGYLPLAQLPDLCNQESVAVHLAATIPPVRCESDQSAR